MLLSALAMDNENFNNLVAGQDSKVFVGSNRSEGKIDIQKGANLNVDEALSVLGGTVNVADGVIFKLTGNSDKFHGSINAIAGDNLTINKVDGNLLDSAGELNTVSGKTSDANELNFHGTIDTTQSYSDSRGTYRGIDGNFYGNKVNLDNAKFEFTGEALISGNTTYEFYGKDDIYVYAFNTLQDSMLTATEKNKITANNFAMEGGEYLGLYGGAVELNNVNLNETSWFEAVAASKVNWIDNDISTSIYDGMTLAANTNNLVSVKNLNLLNMDSTMYGAGADVFIAGGKINIDKTTTTNVDLLKVVAANEYSSNSEENHYTDGFTESFTATKDNTVTINDSSLDILRENGNDMTGYYGKTVIGGGAVSIKDSDFGGGSAGTYVYGVNNLEAMSGKDYFSSDDYVEASADANNKVTIDNANQSKTSITNLVVKAGNIDINKLNWDCGSNYYHGGEKTTELIAFSEYAPNEIITKSGNDVLIKDTYLSPFTGHGDTIAGSSVTLDNTDIYHIPYIVAAKSNIKDYYTPKELIGTIGDMTKFTIETNTDNDVNIKNDSHIFVFNGNILGNKVNIDKSELRGCDSANIIAAQKMKLGTYECIIDDATITGTPENKITITNSAINEPDHSMDVNILGGKIDFKNSNVVTDGKLHIGAGNEIVVNAYNVDTGEIHSVEYERDSNNTATYDSNTTFEAKEKYLSNLVLSDSTEPTPYPEPTPTPQPEPTPDPEPTPTPQPKPTPTPQPEPTPEPTPMPDFDKQDEANISNGEAVSKQIFADNPNFANCKQQFANCVKEINTKAGTDRAKAGQILGLLQGIRNDESRSDVEKQTLQIMILNEYTPSKKVKEYNENSSTKFDAHKVVNAIEEVINANNDDIDAQIVKINE